MKTTPKLTNVSIAYKVAWNFAAKNPFIDSEELISEALLAYVEATRTFKVENGTPISCYIFQVVRNRLLEFVTKEHKHFDRHIGLMDIQVGQNDIHEFDLNDIHDTAARGVAELVIRRAEEINPKAPKQQVYEMLRAEGWKCEQAWEGMRNIKQAIKSL